MDFDDVMQEIVTSRADELETLLRQARHKYTAGESTVTDAVYDAWKDELLTLRADSPEIRAIGAVPVTAWSKVRHEILMGSLEKVNSPEELVAWRNAYGASEEPLLVTEKLDGISIALIYTNGVLSRAVTRGDGEVGEDITPNVRRMKGIPQTLSGVNAHLRGEVIITKSDLARHFPGYKNTRNSAAGLAKRLDGSGVEHLTVLVYQIAEGFDAPLRHMHLIQLQKWGFKTPNWCVHVAPEEEWQEYQLSKRDALDYDIDGLVVEVDNLTKQLALGEKDGRPHGARAFKFAAPARQTILRKIENQTGATGRVTPVAVFDTVDLLGTSVTNASLYNWKYIRDLGLDIGAKILVARANDVIPRVTELVEGTGTLAAHPTECTSCGGSLEWDGEYLVCLNQAQCPAQALGRLQRYIKELNILEWGEAVLERLLEAGLVKDVVDLYSLTQDQLAGIERMGEKSAATLLKTLWAKNPIPVEQFLGALSIPGCATSTISMIMDAGFDTLTLIRTLTLTQLQGVKGLGPIKSEAIYQWLQTNSSVIDAVLAKGVRLSDRVKGTLTGLSFCFTGKTKTKRPELEAMVKNAGGTVKSSVGKGLSYLVMSDPNSGSSKAQAAAKHGTKTISEDDFLGLVGT